MDLGLILAALKQHPELLVLTGCLATALALTKRKNPGDGTLLGLRITYAVAIGMISILVLREAGATLYKVMR